MGCHVLLQCVKVKSEIEVTQSCLTLSNPMDYSLPVSSIHGIFQARVLEWAAIAFSEECVTYTQLIGPQNLFYGNFIGIPQHTRLLEIRQKIREAFCLKMSFLKVKSWRQS